LLKDPSSRVRTSAAKALEDYGRDPEVVADLVTAADDEEREVRVAAAQALLKLNGAGDRTAARTLLAMVADPGPIPDRLIILTALSAASEDVRGRAVALLAELSSRAEPSVLPDVISCLIEIGPLARGALPALGRLLNDEDPDLRAEVGMAVVMIEGKESQRAVEILARMIADAELTQERRQTALGMLQEVNRAAAAKSTSALIRQLGDADPQVRRNALDLLSQIVDDTAAEMPAPAGEP
jgi:HEAT repeat protein